ncbi:MAG TPA: sigma-70 family RNA polymerase sigma factor [Tepidisphaeraceae bacterium]
MDRVLASERFYRMVWPHRASVLRLARILSREDGEDLAQETLLKAFAAIERLEEGANALPWLAAILRNARIDRLRKGRPEARDVALSELGMELAENEAAAEVAGEWERPEELLEAFSDQQVIDALAELPEEIRWTLLLVEVQGMDQAEAAKILEVPVGTIKSRAHRGRAMLRESLRELAKDRGWMGRD